MGQGLIGGSVIPQFNVCQTAVSKLYVKRAIFDILVIGQVRGGDTTKPGAVAYRQFRMFFRSRKNCRVHGKETTGSGMTPCSKLFGIGGQG